MAAEVPIAELGRRALLTLDRRSLGLGRIALGLVLVGDLARRAMSARLWYADDGPLPSAIYERANTDLASLLLAWPGTTAVVASFALALVFDVALLVGYRTKLAQVLAFAALVNLQSRVPHLQNGGDRMLGILCFWTLFLPLGDRFSIDARRRPRGANEVRSLAVLAVLLQLAVAYFLNSIQKGGATWEEGTAVGYVLRDPTLTSGVGCAASAHAPGALVWALTRATRMIEFIAPFLILSPLSTTAARRIALALLVPFHLGIALTLNVGVFSFAMMAYFPLLLGAADWEVIERIAARFGLRLAAEEGRASAIAVRREIIWAREATVALFLLLVGHRVLVDNGALPVSSTPRFAKAMIDVPRLYQLWSMFGADHREASLVLVDAETEDGRHVDPLNEAATPALPPPPWTRLPECMNRDAFIQNYAFAVRSQRALRPALGAFVLRYPERTGRASDRLVRFTVFDAKQAIPPPGDAAEPSLHLEPLIRYPSEDDARPASPEKERERP